jgi:hypothetical protein
MRLKLNINLIFPYLEFFPSLMLSFHGQAPVLNVVHLRSPLLGIKFIVHQGKHKWDNQLSASTPKIEVQINTKKLIERISFQCKPTPQ